MQPVMGVQDVVEFEKTLAEKGVPAAELMRRAGAVVALQAAKFVDSGSVVVMCGSGNNGGDGWVAADNLARHGYEVCVVSAATPAVLKGEVTRRMASRAAEMGVPVHVNPTYDELCDLLEEADVVVDAVFGTGFRGALPGPYDMWVQAVDDVFCGSVVSVDVPSGISATTGMSEGPCFKADVTVAMLAAKPGLISGEGRAACGELVVASLASTDEGVAQIKDAATAFLLGDRDYAPAIPEVNPLQDKFTRGRVLVVAGSARFPGAAVMAALAAARAGAGYVTLAVPQPVVPVAQAHLLSVPVVGLPADDEGAFSTEAADRVAALAAKSDVVLAGPGMTTSFGAGEVVRQLLAAPVPLVLDADALNVLVKICLGSAEEHPEPLRRESPLVLTPHRLELARLVGADPAKTSTLSDAMKTAQRLAWSVGSADFCVVAKGPVTAVSTIDSTVIPEPGPASLATAGTGDVLAGVLTGLLAQRMAAQSEEKPGSTDLMLLMAAGDRIHALAGHVAAQQMGSRGAIATDVLEQVGRAFDMLLDVMERAVEEDEEDAGSSLVGALAFEDEARITPPPEVERLIRADAAARVGQLPQEAAFDDDLEEPEPAADPEPAPVAAPEPVKKPVVFAPRPQAEKTGVMRPVRPGEPAGEGAPAAATPAPTMRVVAMPPTAKPTPSAEATGTLPVMAAEPAPAAGPAETTAFEPVAEPVLPAGATTVMPAVAAGEAPAAPVQPARAVPPFLSGAMERVEACEVAEEPADLGARTALPPFLAQAAADAQGVSAGFEGVGVAAPVREPSPEELEQQRFREFHERATLHIDAESVTPVDERPSAKPRRRK